MRLDALKDIPSYQQVFFKLSTASRNLSTWFGLEIFFWTNPSDI